MNKTLVNKEKYRSNFYAGQSNDVINMIYATYFQRYSFSGIDLTSMMICNIVDADAALLQRVFGGLLVKVGQQTKRSYTFSSEACQFMFSALKYDLEQFQFGIERNAASAAIGLMKILIGQSEAIVFSDKANPADL